MEKEPLRAAKRPKKRIVPWKAALCGKHMVLRGKRSKDMVTGAQPSLWSHAVKSDQLHFSQVKNAPFIISYANSPTTRRYPLQPCPGTHGRPFRRMNPARGRPWPLHLLISGVLLMGAPGTSLADQNDASSPPTLIAVPVCSFSAAALPPPVPSLVIGAREVKSTPVDQGTLFARLMALGRTVPRQPVFGTNSF